MKKIYAFAMAAAIGAISAGAATPMLKTEISRQTPSEKVGLEKAFIGNNTSSLRKLTRAEEEEYTIAGEYTLTLDDVYFEGGAGPGVTGDAEIADNGDGTITLTSSYFPMDVTADYDEITHEITFAEIDYGYVNLGEQIGSYYVTFEPGIWDNDSFSIQTSSYTVTFDVTTGSIIFPADHNFGWVAYSNAAHTNKAGYLDLFDVISFVPAIPLDEEQPGQWIPVGNATFVDAWVLTQYSLDGIRINPADYPYEVELQQNVENENIYRLWAPYHAPDCLVADLNLSNYQGQIVFDMTDPEHVIFFAGIPAGFRNSNGEMYNYNLLGWQIWQYGDTYDDSEFEGIIEFMVDNGQPFSTFEDGVVTVNRSVFDLNPLCENAYSWNGAVSFVSTITFPATAVNNIAAREEAPVYYNMQGMQVKNPASGELVIKRTAKGAVKVIAK